MKLLNLTSKILAIISIFIVPCIIVAKRYTVESTQELVERTTSLGLFPTILIAVMLLVALWFVSNQLSEMIRQSKFGWLAIIFFGLTLGIVLFGTWFMLNTVLISIQLSVEDHIAMMEYHKQTVYYMLYPIGAGIGLGAIVKLLEIDLIRNYLKKLI